MMNTEYQRVLDLFEQWRAFEAPVYTDGVPDYSAAGMRAKLERLPEFRALADAIDTDALTLPERVDLESIRCEMNGMEYYITTLRPYFRDPSFYRLLRDDDTDVPDWEVSIAADVFQPAKYTHPLSPRPAKISSVAWGPSRARSPRRGRISPKMQKRCGNMAS